MGLAAPHASPRRRASKPDDSTKDGTPMQAVEQVTLLIPPLGIMEVFQNGSLDPEAALHARDDEGVQVMVSINRDGTPLGRVTWLSLPAGPVNTKAMEAFHILSGSHMIFTGTVIFLDVDPEKVYEIVATLSRKE
jgi:pyridoxal biosynthesis lyase PdxS